MQFWRSWIFLWALMPVFSAFFGMASYRFLHDTVPIQTHHTWGIIFVFITSATLFLVAPYLALKRHFQRYGVATHGGVLLGAFLGWALVSWLTFRNVYGYGSFGFFRFEKDFSHAIFSAKIYTPFHFWDILSLPWWKLLTWEMATTAITFAVPTFFICVIAGRATSFPRTILFVILAGAAIAVSDAFFDISRTSISGLDVLNGRAWSERLAVIATWSASSVIGASISAIGFGSLLESSNRGMSGERNPTRNITSSGLRLASVTIAVLWSVSYGVYYVTGPSGFRSGFAGLRKSLTSAPERDISVGTRILAFSQLLSTNTYKFPNLNYVVFQVAPNDSSAIVLEKYGEYGSQLVAFDIATGDRLTTLGAPLARYERAAFIWTKDLRHLLVRSRGEPIETGQYRRYETKLTLFELPNYTQVAEWQSTESACQNLETFRNAMLEDDSGNVVILCASQNVGDDARPLAIRLSLPSLDINHVRTFEDRDKGSQADGLIKLGGSIYAPLKQLKGENSFILANISNPELSVIPDNPLLAGRGGELTFQGFVADENSNNTIGIRFCGGTNKVSNPPQVSTESAWGPSFCRVLRFRLSNGSYQGYDDDRETRVNGNTRHPREFLIEFGKWRFIGVVDPASSTGKLIVRDGDSGTTIQTLESSTQIPIATSENLGLLFTHRGDTRQIAVYTISQEP